MFRYGGVAVRRWLRLVISSRSMFAVGLYHYELNLAMVMLKPGHSGRNENCVARLTVDSCTSNPGTREGGICPTVGGQYKRLACNRGRCADRTDCCCGSLRLRSEERDCCEVLIDMDGVASEKTGAGSIHGPHPHPHPT